MSFAKIYSAQTHLLKGKIITIEIDITPKTLHSFTIVGLPDRAVDESKDRMSSALKNTGYSSPKNKNQKIVISLSPADLKKEGPYFDLAMALAYLLSGEEINFDPEGKIFLGELSLNGDLKPIKGTLPLVEEAKRKGFSEVFLPKENAKEGALVRGIKIYGAKNLKEVIDHIKISKEDKEIKKIEEQPETKIDYKNKENYIDFSDIKGQEGAKRGLVIAASGGHNIAMQGPPGTGKTMLAKVFSGILPDLNIDEVLEVTGIYSVAGVNDNEIITEVPFRSPHHSASHVSIIGGGANPKPGEITLAHKGVLFLDEFPEFEKRVIESLRQPLEDSVVSISRIKGSAIFPSNFILIAAMNPCPCGYRGSKQKNCICKPMDLDRYKRKISGPIVDRIDIWVTVGNVDYEKLNDKNNKGGETKTIKEKVLIARKIQEKRFKNHERGIKTNSEMNVKDINIFANLEEETRKILNQSAEKLSLSARAYHRIIKLARTIADLEEKENIENSHILEAIQYRPKNDD